MANYYNINRSVEAYEFRTIDPNNGQLRNILDIAGGGGGGGGSVDLSNYYTKAQTNALFSPYCSSTETDNLLTSYYTKTEMDTSLGNKLNVSNPEITGVLKGNEFDSKNNVSNIQFKHNNAIYLEYDYDYDTDGGLVLGKPLALSTSLDIPLNSKLLFQHTDSYINETLNSGNFLNVVMKEQTGQIDFYVGDPANASNLVMTLENNLITFHKTTSPAIGGGGVDDTNLVKYTGEALQVIENDLVLGGGSQFGSFDLTVNGSAYFSQSIELNLGLSISLGSNKGYIRSINLGGGNHAYDYANFSSGGLHRFYVGGSPFPQYLRLQLSSTQAYFYVDAVCNAELQTNTINTKNAENSDLIFKRNDVEYMRFEGTQQAVELTQGAKSNTYDSIGNADVSFRRNTIDFLYFRNGQVEVNTGLTLYSENAKIDTIDTTSDTDMVFKRNGTEFFKLGTGYTTVDGAPTNLLNIDSSTGVSSGWLFANAFANRSNDTNTEFRGAISGGSGWGKIYMLYEHIPENLHFYTNVEVDEGKKLYLNKTGAKECFVHSFVESSVKILSLENNDVSGQNRIYCGGNLIIDMSGTVLNLRHNTNVIAGTTLTGELVDTSDEKLKYDINNIDKNFSDIVKNIKPKTFKMVEEKAKNIVKNHIGFIAKDVAEYMPKEFENIVIYDNDVKKLNYIKMNAVLWGCVQEQMDKIEHLESRLFEVENFIKDFVKPKPKAKSKSKN